MGEKERVRSISLCVPFFVLGAVSQNTNDSVSDVPLPKTDLPITTFVTHTPKEEEDRRRD